LLYFVLQISFLIFLVKHFAKFIFHAHNSTLKNAKVIAEQSSYNLLAAIPCIFKSALYLLPKQSKKGA